MQGDSVTELTGHQRAVGERLFRGFVFALPVILLLAGVVLLLFVFRADANHPAEPLHRQSITAETAD